MSITRAAVRNWRLKLAALCIAVLLWITMRLSDDEDVISVHIPGVPVGVELADEGWLLRGSPSPGEVEFTLTGTSSQLLRLARAEPEIVIRIDSIQAEDMVVQLGPEQLRNLELDPGVVADDFRPGSVRLLFERNAVDNIPVSLRLTGELADSLSFVVEPRANLLFAQVRGPKTAVDALEAVFLAPFDLGIVTESGRFEVAVDTVGMDRLTVSPAAALVTVEVAATETRVMGPFPIEARGGGFEFRPAELEVELTGAAALLDLVVADGIAVVAAGGAAELERAVAEAGGDSARVAVVVEGAPPLVGAVAAADSVTALRAGR